MAKITKPIKTSPGLETEFGSTLREFTHGKKPVESLLEHPEFIKRIKRICRVYRTHEYDAEDLIQDVCLKVLRYGNKLTPHNIPDERLFFAWLRAITRNIILDRIRKKTLVIAGEPLEDLSIADPTIDLDRELAEREFRADLSRCLATLPFAQRLATELHVLGGYSSRETAELLNQQGIKCSHVTVNNWTRNGLSKFLPSTSVTTQYAPRKKRVLAKVPIRKRRIHKRQSKG